MSKNITFDFYQVSATEHSFIDFIKELLKIQDREDRNIKIKENIFRWEEIEIDSGYIIGNLVKIRMDLLPSKCKLNAQIQGISFAKDQGVAEENLFLYDLQTETLVYQRNPYGISPKNFQNYLQQMVEKKIEFFPMLTKKGFVKLNKLKEVKSFRYSFAYPEEERMKEINSESTGSFIKDFEENSHKFGQVSK